MVQRAVARLDLLDGLVQQPPQGQLVGAEALGGVQVVAVQVVAVVAGALSCGPQGSYGS
ncbi:hypothetical protein N7U49_23265 [Streptomyces sp. AD2-2]|nr:hypothetical protein N7U49_23265 [Streptomyces sp. AD2-2]